MLAVGANPLNARLTFQEYFERLGDKPSRWGKPAAALLGALTGLGGMLYTSRYGFASFETGIGFEMSVIAACVLGGVSVKGGYGKIGGVLLGAILISIINSALPMIKVTSFAKQFIQGIVILIAIIVNTLSERNEHRKVLQRRVI